MPRSEQLKTAHIYSLIVSVGQESRPELTVPCSASCKAAIKVSAGLRHPQAQQGKNLHPRSFRWLVGIISLHLYDGGCPFYLASGPGGYLPHPHSREGIRQRHEQQEGGTTGGSPQGLSASTSQTSVYIQIIW